MSVLVDAPARTVGPAVARFFESNLRHTKGALVGEAFRLHESQRDDLDVIYEVDDAGRRVWRDVLYGVPRGFGKSPIVAGCGLAELASRARSNPEIYVGSGARDQAKIVGDYARGFAAGGPLRDYTRVVTSGVVWAKGARAGVVPGHLKVVSADGDLQHGLFPSAAILDELHVFRTRKQVELYFAFASAMQKVAGSIFWKVTTAGWDPFSLLGEAYQAMMVAPSVERGGDLGCRLVARDAEAGSLMIWRGAPDDADVEDPAVWRACNPGPWITDAELARLARTLPESVFRRLVLNQWTDAESAVVKPAAWDACADASVVIPDGAPVWVAVSVSPDRRSAAVVVVHRRDDSRRVVWARTWEDEDDAALPGLVAATVREVVARWEHRCVARDAWQLVSEGAAWEADGVAPYRGRNMTNAGFPQTDAFMVPASQLVLALLDQGVIAHAGDADLRRQVVRVESRASLRGSWRFARPKAVGERRAAAVEGAYALAMALYACEQDAGSASVWAGAW